MALPLEHVIGAEIYIHAYIKKPSRDTYRLLFKHSAQYSDEKMFGVQQTCSQIRASYS